MTAAGNQYGEEANIREKGSAYEVTPQFGLVESVAAAKLDPIGHSIVELHADKREGCSQHDRISNPTSIPLRRKTPKSDIQEFITDETDADYTYHLQLQKSVP